MSIIDLPSLNYIDDWMWSLFPNQLRPAINLITPIFKALGWTFSRNRCIGAEEIPTEWALHPDTLDRNTRTQPETG